MDKTSKNKQILLIILAWALYSSAYLGRYSYTANIEAIKNFYKVTSDAQVGAIGSFFFFSYGIGQVVNGLWCKYYNAKYPKHVIAVNSGFKRAHNSHRAYAKYYARRNEALGKAALLSARFKKLRLYKAAGALYSIVNSQKLAYDGAQRH